MAERKRAEARKLEEEARNWDQGAEGERQVGAILDRLPDEYVVFHDLQIPGSEANVDHLVIGPGGVFAIDSKKYTHPVTRGSGRGAGKLWTGRSPLDLKPCRWEASEVESRIGVPVRPVMCIIAPSVPEPMFDFDGVRICQPNRVVAEVTTRNSLAVDVARISALVVQEFNAQSERRSPTGRPVRTIRTVLGLSGRSWPIPVRMATVALVALFLMPLLAPASQWAGAVGSELLFKGLVPTTVPTTVPATSPPVTTVVEAPSTTVAMPLAASFANPPAVPIETACPSPGMGWVASFGWPGDLPAGASAYSIRWQLDGGPIIRHDIGGWTDPADPPVGMYVPNGSDLLFITDYLGDDGQIVASTEQMFEAAGDC